MKKVLDIQIWHLSSFFFQFLVQILSLCIAAGNGGCSRCINGWVTGFPALPESAEVSRNAVWWCEWTECVRRGSVCVIRGEPLDPRQCLCVCVWRWLTRRGRVVELWHLFMMLNCTYFYIIYIISHYRSAGEMRCVPVQSGVSWGSDSIQA